jgi:hypothetical protein
MTETDLPTYQDVLQMLAEKAATGSVSAMIALDRALRPERPNERDEVGEMIDEILARDD